MIESLPVLSADKPKILILGSMPGIESLRQQMYYSHKYNRFFKIMFAYFEKEYSLDIYERKKLITENNIALFDVIKYCERENSSLDSKIKNAEINDIESELKKRPEIQKIILNGKKAGEIYFKYFSDLKINAVILPSTSSANASYSFEKLFDIYKYELDSVLKVEI